MREPEDAEVGQADQPQPYRDLLECLSHGHSVKLLPQKNRTGLVLWPFRSQEFRCPPLSTLVVKKAGVTHRLVVEELPS